MVDRDRVLAKLDELEGYLRELRMLAPDSLANYQEPVTKRACERLMQISIECVLDVCGLLVAGRRLGLPGDEDDVFRHLESSATLGSSTVANLKRMKGLRNILVHAYAGIEDKIVFDVIKTNLGDLDAFANEVRVTLA